MVGGTSPARCFSSRLKCPDGRNRSSAALNPVHSCQPARLCALYWEPPHYPHYPPGRCQPPGPAKGAGSGTQKGPQRPANTVTILNIPGQCGHSFNLGVVRDGCQCNSCYCDAESQGFKGLLSKLCPKSNSRVELLIEGMRSHRLTWDISTSAGLVWGGIAGV